MGSVQIVKEIEAAFAKPIEPPEVSPFYVLGLCLAAASAVGIGLLYLGVVVGIVGSVLYHALHDVTDSAGAWGGMKAAARFSISYYLVLGLGLVLSAIFIKPMIAPPMDRELGPSFQPQEQPELFTLIRCIADALGVPVPQRVDFDTSVNASVGFRSGWRSLFSKGDLVLNLGLPLVASMSVRDLGGLIAHELGHCRQGFAMRLYYVNLMVQVWFHRAILRQDGWEVLLAKGQKSESDLVASCCGLVRLLVAIASFFMKVLINIHDLITSFMARQMEYDADRVAASIAGSQAEGPSLLRISMLSILEGGAVQDMLDRLGRGRLYDNWPEYLATRLGLLTPETRRPVEKDLLQAKRGWFSTHPSIAERFKAAERRPNPGVLHCAAPSRELVRDFRRQCKLATYAMYRNIFDKDLDQFTLVPTEPFIEELEKQGSRREKISRYLAGVYDPWRFPRVRLDSLATTAEPRELLERLKGLRARYVEGIKALQLVLDRTCEAESMLMRTLGVRVIHRSREPIAIAILSDEWQSEAKVFEVATHARRDLTLQVGALGEFEALVSDRLLTVIQLLAWMARLGQPPGTAELLKGLLPDVQSLNRLASVQSLVNELVILVNAGMFAVNVGAVTGELQGTLPFHAATTLGPDPDAIKQVRAALLPGTATPRIGGPKLGEEDSFVHDHPESSDLLVTVERLCKTWRDQYEEVLSRVAGAAEQVEKMLNLDPLPTLADHLHPRLKVSDPSSVKRK